MKKALLASIFLSTSFLALAQEPELLWTRRTGSNFYEAVNALKTDTAGNLLAAGQITMSVDMDHGAGEFVLDGGNGAGFITKYDNDGAFLWSKMFKSSNGSNNVVAMGTDAEGNIYTCGNFSGTTDFNPGTGVFNISTATSPYLANDFYISKLDANGNFIWAKAIQAPSTIEKSVLNMAVDATGNVYITGFTADIIDFDPSPGFFNLGVKGLVDSYIAKYDTDGNFQWVKGYGATAKSSLGYALATDGTAVYATGTFGGNVDFGTDTTPQLLTGHGPNIDVYVLKLTTEGELAWAKNIGASSETRSNSLALDSTGSVYVTGLFNTELDFDPNAGTFTMAPGNGVGAYLLKLNSGGNFTWAKTLATNNGSFGKTVVTDSADNVFLTGQFLDTANFTADAGKLMTSFGDRDLFLAKFNPAGEFLWHKQMGSTGTEENIVVAPDADGTVFASGIFQNTVHFVPGKASDDLTYLGASDFFIAKYGFPETSGTDAHVKETVMVYPNPSKGALFIDVPDTLLGAKATVYTLLGQRMAQFNLTAKTTQQHFASGFYILEVEQGGEKQTVKFIVE